MNKPTSLFRMMLLQRVFLFNTHTDTQLLFLGCTKQNRQTYTHTHTHTYTHTYTHTHTQHTHTHTHTHIHTHTHNTHTRTHTTHTHTHTHTHKSNKSDESAPLFRITKDSFLVKKNALLFCSIVHACQNTRLIF